MDRIVLDPNRAYVCTRTRYTRYTRCTGHNAKKSTHDFATTLRSLYNSRIHYSPWVLSTFWKVCIFNARISKTKKEWCKSAKSKMTCYPNCQIHTKLVRLYLQETTNKACTTPVTWKLPKSISNSLTSMYCQINSNVYQILKYLELVGKNGKNVRQRCLPKASSFPR